MSHLEKRAKEWEQRLRDTASRLDRGIRIAPVYSWELNDLADLVEGLRVEAQLAAAVPEKEEA
ncbi:MULTISPECIES: hypothetical protein [Sorangium]|uniref:Uncharacterized protein n=1 Tax=Sorangium cellulosum TaxID=56 RepID=A0A4V0NFQ4_SORCE|nr:MULTISPECIES: hypothetical protein [Sorangium]AUX30482.1 uncharacterized protein SOCE836_025880 [Sorangium cellulosum]WCQ89876.1 hypothetical protein NQZ70_02574 [Sorangium sp. Soce836]